MASGEMWSTIHAERKALAADLEALDDDKAWDTPSLCTGWTVRDLLAHMTATAKITPFSFLPKLVGSGFSFTKMADKDIAREKGANAAETLSRFKAEVTSSKHPPGPSLSWLGEAIIHSEDIRRPLAISHDYPTAAVVQVADFYKGSNLVVGAKKRIAGVTLKATDAEWTHGEGPEVSGPILSLVLAMTGRKPALADLTGAGAATLSSRA
jgi:uncharacterized protein (TIGR03083 family)